MNSKTKATTTRVPGFSPHADTSKEYYERGAGAIIQRNRWFLMALILGVGQIASVGAMYVMLPLKTVETIQVNKVDGGRLVAEGVAVGNWTPDKDSISYFLNQWANNVFDVNRATIDASIAAASEITIGEASAQLKELRGKDNPLIALQSSLNYSRAYEFITINFIEDNVAFLRFKTTTRKNSDAPVVVTYAMRITFTRVKPTTREQVVRNPAGLFITSFNITEEAAISK